MIFAVVGGWELYNSLRKGKSTKAYICTETGETKISNASLKPILPALITAMVIMYPLVYFMGIIGIIATLAISTIVALGFFTFRKDKMEIADLTATIFNIVYPVIIMGLMIVMNHRVMGFLSIFCVFAVVASTDSMAYFVGVT